MYDLDRFKSKQELLFETAAQELRNGKKQSHWMWYIFPQFVGLGYSDTAVYYGIKTIDEAKEYIADEYLRNNLLELCEILLELDGLTALEIFGYPDNLKLRSCMTLFDIVMPKSIFKKVLDKYYNGEPCLRTCFMAQNSNKKD